MIKAKLVIVYMDDILIFAGTKELTQITRMVLEKLWENNLFLEAKKCKFYKTKIEYLCMIIEEGRISMDSVKLGGIRDWPTPTTVKQIWSFLGFGNFYRKFISHYSDLAQPLNNLRKKDKKFEWTTKCQEAFDILKWQFTEKPVLLMLDQSKPFQIKSTISKDLDTPPSYFLITKTWHTLEWLRNWTTDKLDGHLIHQNLTSNWYIHRDQKWFSLMPYHNDQIMELKDNWKKKKQSCCQKTCLSICWTPIYKKEYWMEKNWT